MIVAVGQRCMPSPAQDVLRLRSFQRQPALYGAMSAYAVASIGLMATRHVGLTAEHVLLLAILAFALLARMRAFVWDWLPFLFVAVMFADLTSVSASIAGSAHTLGPIMFEQAVLHGVVATTWLQAHIGTGSAVDALNTLLTGEYLAHFAAPLMTGLWLWRRHTDQFGRFVMAYTVLMGAGFVVYLIYPEMPPWLAARVGLLDPVHRIVVDSLHPLGGLGSIYSAADPEPNAAMPSLHVALPALIAATMIRLSRRRRAVWLWLAYPLTLSFGVVYLGEHYIADVLVGLGLGVAAYLVTGWAERLTRRRRTAQPATESHR
jgi:membrane-associated phospholipid phosphatase